MLSRSHRFHGHNALRQVYQKGATLRAGSFGLKYVLNPHRSEYRVAVVVSRKVEKSAVARNRIRRRLYEAVRSMEDGISQPYDIVLTVFSNDLLRQPTEALNEQLKSQLSQAGILAKAKR